MKPEDLKQEVANKLGRSRQPLPRIYQSIGITQEEAEALKAKALSGSRRARADYDQLMNGWVAGTVDIMRLPLRALKELKKRVPQGSYAEEDLDFYILMRERGVDLSQGETIDLFEDCQTESLFDTSVRRPGRKD